MPKNNLATEKRKNKRKLCVICNVKHNERKKLIKLNSTKTELLKQANINTQENQYACLNAYKKMERRLVNQMPTFKNNCSPIPSTTKTEVHIQKETTTQTPIILMIEATWRNTYSTLYTNVIHNSQCTVKLHHHVIRPKSIQELYAIFDTEYLGDTTIRKDMVYYMVVMCHGRDGVLGLGEPMFFVHTDELLGRIDKSFSGLRWLHLASCGGMDDHKKRHPYVLTGYSGCVKMDSSAVNDTSILLRAFEQKDKLPSKGDIVALLHDHNLETNDREKMTCILQDWEES